MRRAVGYLASTTALAVILTGVGSPPPAAAAVLGPLEVGPRPNATRLEFRLGDRVLASVDVGTGNLQIVTTELALPGISDDLQLGVTYNSLLLGPGVAGVLGGSGAVVADAFR